MERRGIDQGDLRNRSFASTTGVLRFLARQYRWRSCFHRALTKPKTWTEKSAFQGQTDRQRKKERGISTRGISPDRTARHASSNTTCVRKVHTRYIRAQSSVYERTRDCRWMTKRLTRHDECTRERERERDGEGETQVDIRIHTHIRTERGRERKANDA